MRFGLLSFIIGSLIVYSFDGYASERLGVDFGVRTPANASAAEVAAKTTENACVIVAKTSLQPGQPWTIEDAEDDARDAYQTLTSRDQMFYVVIDGQYRRIIFEHRMSNLAFNQRPIYHIFFRVKDERDGAAVFNALSAALLESAGTAEGLELRLTQIDQAGIWDQPIGVLTQDIPDIFTPGPAHYFLQISFSQTLPQERTAAAMLRALVTELGLRGLNKPAPRTWVRPDREPIPRPISHPNAEPGAL